MDSKNNLKWKIEHIEPEEFIRNAYVETTDPRLLNILEEEIFYTDLGDKDISLLLPELPKRATMDNPDIGGDVSGSRDDGYGITLYPLTIAIWDKIYGRTTRMVIKHELAHIKNGDVDRKLPKPLKWLYNILVEEPRANRAMYN